MNFHSNQQWGLNSSERSQGTATYRPCSVLQPLWMLYSAFLHLDRNKNGTKKRQNPPLCAFIFFFFFFNLNFPKGRGRKKRAEQLFWNKTAALSDDWLQTCEWSDYSSETNSTERLKGRRFGPTGISSCYSPFSQSADRSFIEMSAHHTVCNKRRILFQNHYSCMCVWWGKQMKKQKLEGGKKRRHSARTTVLRKMCIIYNSRDITGEFVLF